MICREGEPGSCLYIILSGQVKLTVMQDTHTETLAYLNAGDFFGESAVLTEEPRSVTAEAVIDAEILLLTQSNFYELVEHDPTIMHNVIRTLDTRIRRRTLGMFHQQPKPSQIISIYSPKKAPCKTFLSVNLAVSLHSQTEQKVVVLDMNMNDAAGIARILKMDGAAALGEDDITEESVKHLIMRHEAGFHLVTVSAERLRNGEITREHLASALSILKTLFHSIIINTSEQISHNTFEALDLSNTVVLLSPIGEEPPTGMFDHQELIPVYYFAAESEDSDVHLSETAPLILPPSWLAEKHFYELGEVIIDRYPHDEVSGMISRIARHIAGLRIGLAFGGMAARGLCHIGVLKVLEAHNIPIDMMAGSNTGAIIGALHALGMNASDMEKIVLEIGSNPPLVTVRDFRPFGGGLLSPRRLIRYLSQYIPENITFHNLKIPLRIITMTLDVGKELPLNSGSLLKAIEPSIAMPGIFPPVKYGDKFLVDGATINPVPISDLIEMDADILVGVNSFVPLTPSYTPPPPDYVNLVGYAENLKLIDIIIRSFQNLQYEISTTKSTIADVTIVPDIIGFSWNDFGKAQQIIDAGQKAAENVLPYIKKTIRDRRFFKKL